MNTITFNPDFTVIDPSTHGFIVMSLGMLKAMNSGEDEAALERALLVGDAFTLSSGEIAFSLEHPRSPSEMDSDVVLVKALEAFCWRYQLALKSADEVLIDVIDGNNPKRAGMMEWLLTYIAAWE
jgi:hypothetical protein